MASYNQQPSVYPQPELGNSYPAYVAPPPAGYPVKDGPVGDNQVRPETRSRGDGFWKGCCAALCCCCVLDMCA